MKGLFRRIALASPRYSTAVGIKDQEGSVVASVPPLIELNQVSRWYGSHHALKDVTVRLAPGRIGLLGPNGAGKSTLLKILLGLLPPSSGTGRVLGLDLARSGVELRRAVGYMPEADALVPGLRGAEYVALAGELYGMPPREARRRAHEVLTCLEMEDARYRPLEEYSTGMKQRSNSRKPSSMTRRCCSLTSRPAASIRPAATPCCAFLLTLGRDHGKSILLSTHLLGDVERVCETVLILHQGLVLLQGGVDAVRTRRQNRYRLQIEGEPATFREELRLKARPSSTTMDGANCAWRHRSAGRRAPSSRWPTITASSYAACCPTTRTSKNSFTASLPPRPSRRENSVMADSSGRGAAPELLHYRPWKGTFRPPIASVWPIVRTGLLMLLRRRLFWGLYALSMMIFLMYFFGQYLLAWFQTQAGESRIVVGPAFDPSRRTHRNPGRQAQAQRLRRHLPELHPLSGLYGDDRAGPSRLGPHRQRLPLRQPAVLPVQAVVAPALFTRQRLGRGGVYQPADDAAGPGPVRGIRPYLLVESFDSQ